MFKLLRFARDVKHYLNVFNKFHEKPYFKAFNQGSALSPIYRIFNIY